ncbi:hypothetical protein [Nocardioides insulae]|uniref:hypothetical protein n=1 Tax=Nocardioides insulae TaxID=394734 RepID=UPI00041C5206|nr:hypothetical protein [Nocardioides insulae]
MSTTASAPLHIDTTPTAPIPFLRLVRVEWRKMIDTRGGRWLLAITAALVLLAFGLTLLVVGLDDAVVSAGVFAQVMAVPLSLLLPVLAILIVTSEWSQRTTMVTFAFEPHRLRVVLAKLVAVVCLALVTLVLALALGALGTVVGAEMIGGEPIWDLGWNDVAWLTGLQLVYLVMGFALALLFLNTPSTVAVYYVASLLLPYMVWGILFSLFDWAQTLLPFLDITYAVTPFQTGNDVMGQPVDTGFLEVLQLLSALTIWVFGPLVLGTLRVLRSEVK